VKILRLVAILLALTLAGCGKPVPADKAAYVGEWQNKIMYLLITQDGSVVYKRLKGGATVSVSGPLQGFNGNSFDVGLGPLKTTFNVDKPPYQEDGQWKMEVDGVPLTRTPDSGTPPAPAPAPAAGSKQV
jgi:hypothetical protein